jgi:hypothetical protein
MILIKINSNFNKYYTITVEIKDNEAVTDDKYTNLTNSYVEFGSEFTMIMASHPDKNSKDLKKKS